MGCHKAADGGGVGAVTTLGLPVKLASVILYFRGLLLFCEMFLASLNDIVLKYSFMCKFRTRFCNAYR